MDEKLFLLNNVFAVQIVQNNIKDAVHTTDIYKLIPRRFAKNCDIMIQYQIVFNVKLYCTLDSRNEIKPINCLKIIRRVSENSVRGFYGSLDGLHLYCLFCFVKLSS